MYKVKISKKEFKMAENAKDLRRLITLLIRAGIKDIHIIKL
jgi:hypothetical protein